MILKNVLQIHSTTLEKTILKHMAKYFAGQQRSMKKLLICRHQINLRFTLTKTYQIIRECHQK